MSDLETVPNNWSIRGVVLSSNTKFQQQQRSQILRWDKLRLFINWHVQTWSGVVIYVLHVESKTLKQLLRKQEGSPYLHSTQRAQQPWFVLWGSTKIRQNKEERSGAVFLEAHSLQYVLPHSRLDILIPLKKGIICCCWVTEWEEE